MADYLKATASVPASFAVDGLRIRPGEQFISNSPRVTKTLITLGLAEIDTRAFVSAELDRQVNETVDRESVPAGQPRKRGRPRKYERRDMRAED